MKAAGSWQRLNVNAARRMGSLNNIITLTYICVKRVWKKVRIWSREALQSEASLQMPSIHSSFCDAVSSYTYQNSILSYYDTPILHHPLFD